MSMADERRIGGVDGRPAAEEDDAARKARQHVLRRVGSMYLEAIAVLQSKVGHRAEGAVPHVDDVAARELEETLDISDIFAAAIELPRQMAVEAELAAEPHGDDGADISDFHQNPPRAFLASQKT